MRNYGRIIALLLLILSMLLITACGGGSGTGDGGNGTPDGGSTDPGDGGGTGAGTGGENIGGDNAGGDSSSVKKYKVTVIYADGVIPLKTNPIEVSGGEKVSFDVGLENGYLISEVEGAEYDPATRTVSIAAVTKDVRVRLSTEQVDYSTTGKFNYSFEGMSLDRTSIESGAVAYAGTPVTVRSNYNEATFIGWSFGKLLKDGGEIVSTEREYSFVLSPSIAVVGTCRIFANYSQKQENAVYYYLNGGSLNTESPNMKASKYYTTEVTANSVKVTLSNAYFDAIGAVACLFWDDGTFYREGYVLKEYNTKPDGTGVGYGAGYKYPIKTEGSDLYCIWAKDTSHGDFSYSIANYELPSNVKATNVPHWSVDGIIITEYRGDAREVVIPEKIDGKVVTGIASGAFTNKKLDTLVLHRRLIELQTGAFVGCENLETIYYPDGIYYVSNDSFDTASWRGVKNLYVNATIAPRLGEGWTYAIKFTRFIANPEKKRVALLAGSSGLYGHSAGYLEALLGADEWCSINFGMVRSFDTHLIIPLLGHYAKDGDVLLFAPENSVRNMGYPEVYWKSLTYLESMMNFYRAVDISYYKNILSTFAEINQGSTLVSGRFTKAGGAYERIMDSVKNYSEWCEYDNDKRYSFNDPTLYKISGSIRFDKMYQYESAIGHKNGEKVDITTTECVKVLNYEIELAQKNGALVYYNFAPVADTAIFAEAREMGPEWFDNFESFIIETFSFDNVLGEAENYIFAVKYFYDSAYHPNNYGKSFRTYRVYLDLCEMLGITEISDYYLGGEPDEDGYIRDENGKSLYHATLFESGSEGGLSVEKAKIFNSDTEQ